MKHLNKLLVFGLLIVPNIALANIGIRDIRHTYVEVMVDSVFFLAIIALVSIVIGYLFSRKNESKKKAKIFFITGLILLTISIIGYGASRIVKNNIPESTGGLENVKIGTWGTEEGVE